MSVFEDLCWLNVDSRVTQTFRVQPMLSIHSQFAESSLHGWLLSCCSFLKLCPRPDAILGREDKMVLAHICCLPGCAHLVALADAFEREPDDQSKPRQSWLCVANHRANMSTKYRSSRPTPQITVKRACFFNLGGVLRQGFPLSDVLSFFYVFLPLENERCVCAFHQFVWTAYVVWSPDTLSELASHCCKAFVLVQWQVQ